VEGGEGQRAYEAQAWEEGVGGGAGDVAAAGRVRAAAQQCCTIRQVVR